MDSSAPQPPVLLPRRLLISVVLILILPLHAAPTSASGLRCTDTERNSLLRFKAGLRDPDGRLSSWTGLDCCLWSGVTCDLTGAVVKLDLKNPHFLADPEPYGFLNGKLDASLLKLESLAYLDLSHNKLDDVPIPAWLGSFRHLEYLDLCEAGFAGAVPPQLSNLSTLRHLDISYLDDPPRLHVESFNWISRLSSLRFLSMSGVNLSGIDSTEVIQTLNDNLTSLADLRLDSCGLSGIPQFLPSLNFTSLKKLDLSWNNVGPIVPPWILNITSLETLGLVSSGFHGLLPSGLSELPNLETLLLSDNNFSGTLPRSIGKLCKLDTLYLEFNNLNSELPQFLDLSSNSSHEPQQNPGHLPRWLEDLKNLKYLELESNMFTGGLPLGIGKMTKLMHILVSDNQLTGELSEAHLTGLKDLITLEVNDNRALAVTLRPDWTPPFQVERLGLGGCRVGPRFPTWIKNQVHLENLDLSNAGISDTIPAWFWGFSPPLSEISLSSNLITGTISEKISSFKSLTSLNLSTNRFSGRIPLSMTTMPITLLDLSNNNLSGQVPLGGGMTAFNTTAFEGNPLLCGPPTNVNCPRDHGDRDGAPCRNGMTRNASFYLGAAAGAAVGILVALLIWSYRGRFRQQEVEGKSMAFSSDGQMKDGRLK
ncbi:unnamed protein product [Spirodela intermedia]|uniref:Uncharacterized protein n=1 Tax=Spirodela intermedia TaxID=51605 RepID=A0A7I8IT79_SPIIN|nr:unnamed protein product [Spirodela intermedia]CAA6660814.1 unnamed protein product [Spirodela intermedia]